IRAELARGYCRLGKLYRETARFRDSVKAYETAIGIQEQLSTAFPRQSEYRRDLGKSLNDLGEVFYDTAAAPSGEPVNITRRALHIRQALAQEHPGNPQYQFDLAESYNNLGNFKGTEATEAKRCRSKALEIARPLAAAHPEVAEFQYALGMFCHNCAWFAGSPAGSLPFQEEAVSVLRNLVVDHPENTVFQDLL